MGNCTCKICGPCIAEAAADTNNYGQATTTETTTVETAPFRSLSLPGGVIVYILGKIGTNDPQIDVYSGINGWHIRTIPSQRFIKPVMIGAGAGALAVVDRFPDYDIIRITDEWAGGGQESYDINGFPLKTVNFATIPDFRQVRVPKGARVTGLKILANGMLIAGLQVSGSVEVVNGPVDSSGNPTSTTVTDPNGFLYLKALSDQLPSADTIDGTLDPEIFGGPFDSTTPYEGVSQLPSPFDTLGIPTGSFSIYGGQDGDRAYQIFGGADSTENGSSVVLFDFVKNKAVGHFGLPSVGKILSLSQAGEIINVLFSDNNVNQVIRAKIDQSTYFMIGQRSDKEVPTPDEYPIYHTFSPQDDPTFANVQQPTIDDLVGYLTFSGFLSKDSNYFGKNTTVIGKNVYTVKATDSGPETVVFIGTVTQLLILLLSGGTIDASDPSNPIIQPTKLPFVPDGPFTPFTPPSDSNTETNRQSQPNTYTTNFGGTVGTGTCYPVNTIVPNGSDVSDNPQYLEGTNDTVTELYTKQDGSGKPDITKPLFLNMHGSHYDWLSHGGFVYGCTNNGVTVAQTNGIVGIWIATDLSGELGQHKDLPDLKAVLYDTLTGLVVYRHPKPQGFTIFGGPYATLELDPNISSGVAESGCGTNLDTEASIFDGIERNNPNPTPPQLSTGYPVMASDEVPVAAWSEPQDLDFPWQFFERRVGGITTTEPTSNGGTQYVTRMKPTTAGWSYQNPNGSDILPWWRSGGPGELVSPATVFTVGGTLGTLFYPVIGGVYAAPDDPNGIHKPVLTANVISGFFNLGLPMIQTTTCQQLQESINNNDQQLSLLQSQAATATGDQLTALNQQIATLQTTIATQTAQLAACNPTDPANVAFEVPDFIQNLSLPVNPSTNIQTVDPILGGSEEIPAAITPGTPPWQAVTVPGDDTDTTRGIVIDPGIRSWVAVEVKLNRDNGAIDDGATVWAQPETRTGRFGVNVGPATNMDIINDSSPTELYPFCGGILPGFVYDAGDSATGGATGAWEVEISSGGSPLANLGTQVTFEQQITALAPGDMQQGLITIFNLLNDGGGIDPDVGLHFGKVYFSDQQISEVTIKVRLVNYAFDVYRFGAKTIQYVTTVDEHDPTKPAQPGDPFAIITGWRSPAVFTNVINGNLIPQFTFGADPGYAWGDNCEAFCFGNLTCSSVVFQGSKLCQSDPTDAVVRNVLWEGVATYQIPATNNPYTSLGLAIGEYLNCYFEFQLNSGLFNYDINLRSGEGRTQQGGNCGS